MRRTWFVLLAVLLLGSTPFKIRTILERAVNNERDAAARYEAFAAKAIEEGYPGAANLFRAASRAELVHADRFATALRERGLPVPEPEPRDVNVGSTAENLRAAAMQETGERDGFYAEAIADAHAAGDDNVAKLFDQTRDTENEHMNLLADASRNVEKMRQPKTYYVCDKCGYTTDVKLGFCALCRNDERPHPFE